MTVIYHSRDLDGWCSAAIVKKWFYTQQNTSTETLKLIGWDYGDKVPLIEGNESVIMVDISFEIDIMKQLTKTNSLIWIDHHISAIKEMEANNINPKGVRNPNYAACELSWKFFFGIEMPEFVRLLGRYDCIAYKGTNEEQKVLEFQYAARAYFKDPEDCYKMLYSDETNKNNIDTTRNISHLLKLGKGIYKYLCTDARLGYKKRFTIDFDGYKFVAFNKERFNPINFGIHYHEDKTEDGHYYDGACSFWFNNGKWNFSLYNDNGKVDCSKICKIRNGGGHAEAAGFQFENINSILSHK